MIASHTPTKPLSAIPPGEPSPDDFRGGFWRRVVKRLLLSIRPQFVTGGIIPVIVGSVIGWREQGELEVGMLLITLTGALCALGAGNICNDIVDDLSGDDRENQDYLYPYTGGSRFIQNGIMSRQQLTAWATILFSIATLLGIFLIFQTDFGFLYYVAAGSFLIVVYFGLTHPVIYELSIWSSFGPLHVTTAAYLQTGFFSWQAFLISLPIAFWITNVLLVAELPDARADLLTGKKTIATLVGARGIRLIYFAFNLLALAGIVVLIIIDLIPIWGICLPLVLWLMSIRAMFGITEHNRNGGVSRQTIVATILIHSLGGLWLAMVALWPCMMQC